MGVVTPAARSPMLLPVLAPHERARFAYTAIGFMCVASAALIARTVGDTLFLTRYSGHQLSYMYLGTALSVSLASYTCGAWAGRVPIARFIGLPIGVLILAALVLRVLLVHPWGGLRIAAYLLGDLLVHVPVMLFWSFAALIFNPREAKRLFGFVGAGGTLACILAGFLVRPYATHFGTENLLIWVILLLGGFVFTVVRLSRLEVDRLQGALSPGRGSFGLRYYAGLLKADQVRNLALLMLAATVALVLTDYQFKAGVRGHYQDAELAGFFGNFYASASVVALGIQLFLVHRLLGRWGVLPALCILPASLLVASMATAATARLGCIAAAKFAVQIFLFTIDTAALQILYLGIRKRTRSQARAFVDGICKPLAMAAASAALIATTGLFPVSRLAAGAAVASACWLFMSRRNHASYVSALVDSLGARRLDLSEGRSSFRDHAFEPHLRETLIRGTDDEVAYLLDLLPDLEQVDWTAESRALLTRSASSIKIAALNYLRDRGSEEDVQAISAHTDHPAPEVRTAAVRATAALGGYAAAAPLERCLEDPDPAVRAAAAAGLLDHRSADGNAAPAPMISALLASRDPDDRVAMADALSHTRGERAIPALTRLLEDSEDVVRRAALRACRLRAAASLIPAIVPLLADPSTAEDAAETLAALGPEVLSHLVLHLSPESSGEPFAGADRIPAILARVGDLAALPALRRVLGSEDLHLRSEAVRAYCRLLRRVPSVRPYRTELDAAARQEISAAAERLATLQQIAPLPAAEILADALKEQHNRHLQNALLLLEVRMPDVDMNAIYHHLSEGTDEARADALEIIDNTLKSPLKAPLVSLLEPLGRPADVPAALSCLTRLLRSHDFDWMMAGALYAAAQNGLEEGIEPARGALRHPSPVVRETALYTLHRLGQAEARSEVRLRMARDPDPRVQRLVHSLSHLHPSPA